MYVSSTSRVLIFMSLYLCAKSLETETEKTVVWGETFDRFIKSKNVPLDCTFEGHSTCCAFSDDESKRSGFEDVYSHPNAAKRKATKPGIKCRVTRKYIPSPYEIEHFEKAKELNQISDDKLRRQATVDYIKYDLPHSKVWLERVKIHMQTGIIHNTTQDDEKYLSRFEVSRTCGKAGKNEVTWIEWIEPLTIHGRHPLGLHECSKGLRGWMTDKDWKFFYSTDYVLLQSGQSLTNQGVKPKRQIEKSGTNGVMGSPFSNYLFDAGASTFDSSLVWFVCAYLQRKVEFNQFFAWESTLLEPNTVWKRVPTKLLPLYHFLNIPVSSGLSTEYNAVINMIEQTAVEDDFVALKLDIDTPHVEIPIALELAKGGRISNLVDEFFFELHFRCDLMMECGWGKDIPKVDHGLTLDRPSAMELFRKIRELGIRSHYWP